MHSFVHACVHACRKTYVNTETDTSTHPIQQSYKHARTHTHRHIQTWIHIYIQYMYFGILCLSLCSFRSSLFPEGQWFQHFLRGPHRMLVTRYAAHSTSSDSRKMVENISKPQWLVMAKAFDFPRTDLSPIQWYVTHVHCFILFFFIFWRR